MRATKRLLLAAVIAPTAPIVVLILHQFITGDSPLSLAKWENDEFALLVLVCAYALTLVLGFPAYFVVRRLERQDWYFYVAAAFVMGMVAFPLVSVGTLIWALITDRALAFTSSVHLALNTSTFFASIAVGIISAPIGLLFWLISRPDRP